jgi:hypothetical protein
MGGARCLQGRRAPLPDAQIHDLGSEDPVRTIDARLLVRHSQEVDVALRQLLTGVLRVHAVVALTALPSGLTVPSVPVHYLERSLTHHADVGAWDGRRLSACPGVPHRRHASTAQPCPLDGA